MRQALSINNSKISDGSIREHIKKKLNLYAFQLAYIPTNLQQNLM